MSRKNKIERISLLSLSIGVVSTGNRAISSYGELASIASEVKKRQNKHAAVPIGMI